MNVGSTIRFDYCDASNKVTTGRMVTIQVMKEVSTKQLVVGQQADGSFRSFYLTNMMNIEVVG